ncbi:acyl-CoA synthetase [Pseudomonas aeruginosa]|uniref:acyl-CoA synthetase n=1 Tax=Pseudomonas aeruginosa TaxID=287 RepID=UPI00053D3FF7|nr:acyl-CoA synthetase [Pseudomonas aeruginosa]MCO2030148.1 acyl-CoA synthetase [Pseudomonas aeruginosa]MCS7675699.1 acyl-CoA synthetase [Pseudomonas aeruginosa]MCS7905006.1 acyl-CoA synthetase [Pseudomonas aeruginosa]MCS9345769.1 acyl-CoA synthetase [Pseudomonas aeruginosa]MCS9358608.1 acyl-CoA synthetase [Pseudomonas aeruginosa]
MAVRNLADIEAIESVPLERHDLPPSTYAALQRCASANGDRPALSFFFDAKAFQNTHDWTYAELFADITRAANAFHGLGIGATDVVAFILPNLPETHFTIWGGEAAGIVLAINPLLEAAQIGELLRAANAKLVVTLAPTPGTDLWPKLASQLDHLPCVQDIVWVSMSPYVGAPQGLALRWMAQREKRRQSGQRIHDLRSLMRRQPGDRLLSGRYIRAEDHSSYFCTGGTTGLPKIAMRTHGSEVFNAWAMARNLQPREPGQVMFCGLPLFHVNGQLVTGLMPWTHGDRVIVGTPQGYRGEGVIARFWAMVEHFGINFFSGVPTVYSSLLQQPREGRELSSLQYALCGAAPMPVGLFREFEQQVGVRILEGYGLTEGACVSSSNPPDGERRVGSIGLRLAYQGMRVVVLDDAGQYLRDAQADEAGTLIIRGPNVFAGYLNASQNEGVWVVINGARWLNTGDLGRQDVEGYFWLTGRKKELIIRGGHNIDPKQIEEVLQSHPAVAMAAAVGSPDAHAGEVPVAYVQLNAGMVCGADELQQFAATRIHERAALPKRIEVVGDLPLTPVGKIFKPALLKREIAMAIEQEAESAGISGVAVEVLQDAQKGLVARIGAGEYQARLEDKLRKFTFAVEWVK